jgi:hypothetical protein
MNRKACVGTILVLYVTLQLMPAVFATRDPSGWGIATTIETESGNVEAADVAMDPEGNAIAVWAQRPGPWIWANRYVPGVGWGTAEVISGTPGGSFPRVAMDAAGNAIAVWSDFDDPNGTPSIWANRYERRAGWGTSGTIETDPTWAGSLDLAVNPGGVALVTWVHDDGNRSSAWWNRYVPGAGWGTANLLGPELGARIAIDPAGGAVAVWNSGLSFWAAQFTNGTGWGNPTPIDPDGWARWPELAMDETGNAFVVWHRDMIMWANRYDVAVGWEGPVRIGTGNPSWADHDGPRIGADADGNAVVVWNRILDNGQAVFANRFSVDTGWQGEENIDLGTGGWFPQVAVSAIGTAIAIWDGGGNIYANRYVPGDGWAGGELAETTGGRTGNPHIAMDRLGNAIAIWNGASTERLDLWANRYVAPDTTSPSLRLTSPADGMTTDQPSVVVSGTTEPGAQVSVNGLLASVAAEGTFSLSVALKEGTNVITVVAEDAAGNRATASVTVTHVSPVPGLERDLRGARDALDAVRRELADARLATALALVGLAASIFVAAWFRRRTLTQPARDAASRPEPENR